MGSQPRGIFRFEARRAVSLVRVLNVKSEAERAGGVCHFRDACNRISCLLYTSPSPRDAHES
eukprot:747273-Prymnesium_polylepis.1